MSDIPVVTICRQGVPESRPEVRRSCSRARGRRSKLEREPERPRGAADAKHVLLRAQTPVQTGTSPLGKNVRVIDAHSVVEVLRGVDVERVQIERETQGDLRTERRALAR